MESDFGQLSGKILVANPSLMDPNFHRTVIHLSLDAEDDGTIGIILNRPLGQKLGSLNPKFAKSAIADLPLYFGGPVQADEMLIAAWQWDPELSIGQFHFGINIDAAEKLMSLPFSIVRGYMGYSGWSQGQLNDELKEGAWLVADPSPDILGVENPLKQWRMLVKKVDPALSFLADIPDDPSKN